MEIKVKRKKCSKCNEIKLFCEFGVDNNRKSGLKQYCKNCRKNESDENKDRLRKQIWYQNNRELTINRAVNRQIEKREDRKKYLQNYYQKNPHIYMWRSLVYRTLNGKIKDANTFELLGYDYNELKNHISNLFTDGMSWDNYGEWHIDHIRPLSSFSANTPINVVNALSNLQPLWATTREINGILYEGNLNKLNSYE